MVPALISTLSQCQVLWQIGIRLADYHLLHCSALENHAMYAVLIDSNFL